MSSTLTCAQCATEFPAPPVRRGARPQRFCTPKCQIKAANARRSIKRRGNLSTAGKTPERPLPSTLPDAPAKAQTPLSDAPTHVDRSAIERLAFLMDKAHSRVGVTAWEIAEIARARGISAWAPVAKIIAREVTK
jgi:hypothetical protein